MNVERYGTPKRLEEVEFGKVFMHNGDFYLRCADITGIMRKEDRNTVLAVDLSTGHIGKADGSTVVVVLRNAKLVPGGA